HGPARAAPRRATRRGALTGPAGPGGVITAAGAVLAGTFAVLGTLPVTFLTELGFTVAFGVLLDTLVVRSVLVTALNLDLGRRVWWPSRLARQPAPEAESLPGVPTAHGEPTTVGQPTLCAQAGPIPAVGAAWAFGMLALAPEHAPASLPLITHRHRRRAGLPVLLDERFLDPPVREDRQIMSLACDG